MKKIITLSFLILWGIITVIIPVQANCSIRTLKNVCDICEERALKKANLNVDSANQNQPEVNCPTSSFSCIQQDTFIPLLKEK